MRVYACILFLLFTACNESVNRNTTVQPPTASPVITPAPFSLKGSATLTDDAGDVTNEDGNRARRFPAEIDLTEVRLEIVEPHLLISFTVRGDIPQNYEPYKSAIWRVTAWKSDESDYCDFRVQLIGHERFSSLLIQKPFFNHRMDAPVFVGNKITARYPLDRLPAFMRQPFLWNAGTETGSDMVFNDLAPNDRSDTVKFPQ